MTTSEPTPPAAPAPPAPPPTPPPTPPAAPASPASTPAATPNSDDNAEDGLFDVKEGDPAWIRRLRIKGAGYRTERNELRTRLADYEARDRTAAEARRGETLKSVAEKHGLWDAAANDGKGALLPGVSLGDDPAKMEEIAAALATHLRGKPGSSVAARRPATVAATTSGTSAQASAGPSRAAEALRELVRGRATTAE